MLDLGVLAQRKSVTISDLKKRAEEIHREVGLGGKVYTLRFGEHEDMAVVPLGDVVDLARDYAEVLNLLASMERVLAAQTGIPVLGGPDEDDIIRERLSVPTMPGNEVLAKARAKLGLD